MLQYAHSGVILPLSQELVAILQKASLSVISRHLHRPLFLWAPSTTEMPELIPSGHMSLRHIILPPASLPRVVRKPA
jgi:hypothetical protein